MDFLHIVESVHQDAASVQRLFGSSDGVAIRGRARSPKYMQTLKEAVNFVAEILDGRRPMHQLQEAMSTSDFPNLYGDILDRQMLANYRQAPSTWRAYLKTSSVRDFRDVKRGFVNGAQGRLSAVAEGAEYPEAALADGKYTYAVKKYGRKIPFTWEALVNDDLDAFRSLPERLALAARRTEEHFVTDLYAGASGPDATFFAAGNANIITANPALSVAAMDTAFKVLAAQVDSDGEPITIDAVHLVVPPALQVTARNILNATQIEVTETGGTSNQKLIVANWMRNNVTLHVNPYLPIVSSSANGNASWYLFADPSQGRPAAEVGFLRGYEEPQMFIKAPNAQRVGGGGVDPMTGDFDTDGVQYKVRHVMGGTLMDPKAAVASNGTGS